MIGFLLVTHNHMGKEMVQTVENIIKEHSKIQVISVKADAPYHETQKEIHHAIQQFNDMKGVIILTDLFGATPSNLCKEFLINGKVELITGCNLPMLIKASTTKFDQSPSEVAQFLKNYGRENIRVYSTDY